MTGLYLEQQRSTNLCRGHVGVKIGSTDERQQWFQGPPATKKREGEGTLVEMVKFTPAECKHPLTETFPQLKHFRGGGQGHIPLLNTPLLAYSKERQRHGFIMLLPAVMLPLHN